MQSDNAEQNETQSWYFPHDFILPRFVLAVFVAAIIPFFGAVGQPDGWRWFLILFAATMPALLLVVWLVGEICVAAIVFVEEWRDVFSSDGR